MSSASEKALKKKVREIQQKGTFNKPSRGSSLDGALQQEVRETEGMLGYLATYKGQHAVLRDFIRKMNTTVGWVPTAADRRLFYGIIRNTKRNTHIVQEADPIKFAAMLDIDTRPSSLEA